ncbi:MAG: stage II sporulation protein R [Defluviitaleaceae bacterium]|nr:stage II sporulation protein R [Defluviitaleaceae bacterium]
MLKIANFLRNESKIIAVSLAIGILFAVAVAAYTYVYSATTQREIAENVIRFHVMAHSDDADDQALKEHIRTEILAEFTEQLSANICIEETRTKLQNLLPYFAEHADKIIRDAGLELPVTAEMSSVFFPTQFYGNIAFPPGIYEAVQIVIGNGTGQNWWCLMFPPLCYVDMTSTDAGRNQLEETVSEEGFRLLTHQEESIEIQVRFRVVQWWQNRRNPAPAPQNNQQIVAG